MITDGINDSKSMINLIMHEVESAGIGSTMLINMAIHRNIPDAVHGTKCFDYEYYIVIRKQDKHSLVMLDNGDFMDNTIQFLPINKLRERIELLKEPDRFLKAIRLEYLPIDSFINQHFNNEK